MIDELYENLVFDSSRVLSFSQAVGAFGIPREKLERKFLFSQTALASWTATWSQTAFCREALAEELGESEQAGREGPAWA